MLKEGNFTGDYLGRRIWKGACSRERERNALQWRTTILQIMHLQRCGRHCTLRQRNLAHASSITILHVRTEDMPHASRRAESTLNPSMVL